MLDVVAVCTGRGHDGRVGDGGAVVAADSAGKACGDTDHKQVGSVSKDGQHDGDQDAEGAPAGAGGESQTDRDEEDDRREHGEQAVSRALNETRDVYVSTEETGHVLEGERECEDEQCGDHCDKTLGDAGGSVLESDDAAQEQVHKGDDQRNDAAPGKANRGVGIGKGINEACAVPEAADIHHADDAEYYKYDDRNEHIPNAGVLNVVFFIVADGAKLALKCLHLGLGHGAVIKAHNGDRNDEYDGQQGIEIVGNGLNEKLDAGDAGVKILRGRGNGSCPGGHGRDHAYRRGSRVNNICELCAGDVVAVGDGTHDGADGQAVEIVVNKNEHTEDKGGDYRADAAVNMLCSPAAKRGGAAGGVDECDHDAQQNEEHEDTCVPAVRDGTDESVVEHGVE